MRHDELPDDLMLSEAQVREIIELAARIPRRSDGVSLAVLREIAQELDIEQDALTRAIYEVLAKRPRPSLRLRLSTWATRLGLALDRFLPQRGRGIAAGLIGSFLGWLSAYIGSGLREVVNGITVMRGSTAFIDVPITLALILLTLANSLSRRTDGRLARYLAETVIAWGAFLTAWSFTHGGLTDDGVRVTLVCTSACGMWGWLIMRPPKSWRNAGAPVMTPPRTDAPGASHAPGDQNARHSFCAWKGLVSATLLGRATS
jgi:hypothetical protein